MGAAAEKIIEVRLLEPHPKQREFISHPAKRKVIRAGRRGGKTEGISIGAVEWFLAGNRVLYTAPTYEQVGRFWAAVTRSLHDTVSAGIYKKNESEKFIELPNTEQRIKAKTAWNADSLRGDYADKLIFDEWQLCNEDAWELVGAPMMLDTDGDAVFIYTPPSLKSRSVSKANDPQHAAKLFKKAKELQAAGDKRWAAFHFSSFDNPHLAPAALQEIAHDMTAVGYRMEILAEDVDEAPGALWTREIIDRFRAATVPHDLQYIVVGVDPSATSHGDEAGIVVAGKYDADNYVLADRTTQGSPLVWARAAVQAYHEFSANIIVAESNQGGEMVETVIHQVDPDVPVKLIHASRGKQARAEPVSAQAEKGRLHHAGVFPMLEDELCLWIPGDPSPNRLDAMVYAVLELIDSKRRSVAGGGQKPTRRSVGSGLF